MPDTALGRKIKCPKCATPFLVEADGAAPLKPVPSPPVQELAPVISQEPPPPPPSLHQQPLPSAHDLPAEPEPAPPASDDDTSSEPDEPTTHKLSAALPWYYGFIETYTKVAMIAGIAVATIALLFYARRAVLALPPRRGTGSSSSSRRC